jgi:hypothetical protein
MMDANALVPNAPGRALVSPHLRTPGHPGDTEHDTRERRDRALFQPWDTLGGFAQVS